MSQTSNHKVYAIASLRYRAVRNDKPLGGYDISPKNVQFIKLLAKVGEWNLQATVRQRALIFPLRTSALTLRSSAFQFLLLGKPPSNQLYLKTVSLPNFLN